MFTYELPPEKIAQRPRDAGESLLLSADDRNSSVQISDRRFSELPAILEEGDLLVLNDSKVLPTRFFATQDNEQGDSRTFEILLLSRCETEGEDEIWQALVKPLKKLKSDRAIHLSENLEAEMLSRTPDGAKAVLKLTRRSQTDTFQQLIEQEGTMPIPPYIREGIADEADKQRYQTVYAATAGSVAAPTAGLHFTNGLLQELETTGITTCRITHHVGPGSFLPIRNTLEEHQMTEEWYCISSENWQKLQKQKAAGKRIAAVGTTSVRSLESAFSNSSFKPDRLISTNLFITPGYEFKAISALITNFHQPDSTHLQLVAAFFGTPQTSQVYNHALSQEYRFLSYGDSMLLQR